MFTNKIIFFLLIVFLSNKLISNDTYKITIMGKFDGETLQLMKVNLTYLRPMQHSQTPMVILGMQLEEV